MQLTEGQRKWLREIVSIVLGVLIALGLGAVASEIGWRLDVGDARVTIRQEMVDNLSILKERQTVAPCVERRLDQLGALLAEASRTRRLPPVGAIYGPGRPGLTSGAWNAFESAQTLAHFPADELLGLQSLYLWVANYQQYVADDSRAWHTLAMMVGPGRPLDPATEGALYAALSDARYANAQFRGSLEWFGNLIRYNLTSEYADLQPGLPGMVPTRRICEAIGTDIPPVYGQNANFGLGSITKPPASTR